MSMTLSFSQLRTDRDFHDRPQRLDLGHVFTHDLIVQICHPICMDRDDHGVVQVLWGREISAFQARIVVDVEAWVLQ